MTTKFLSQVRGGVMKIGIFVLLFTFSFGLVLSPINAQTVNSISGSLFEDLNFNGQVDLGEEYLSGWEVKLYQNDLLLKTVVTNDNGSYSFSDIENGQYLAVVENSEKWVVINNNFSATIKDNSEVNDFGAYQMIRSNPAIGPFGGVIISNYNIEVLSTTSVKITWFTNYPATSQVVYSLSNKASENLSLPNLNLGYSNTTNIDFDPVTYHEVILTSLEPGSTYYYRLASIPDPMQYRGANRVFSEELIVNTSAVLGVKDNPGGTGGPIEDENSGQTVTDIIQEDSEPIGSMIDTGDNSQMVDKEEDTTLVNSSDESVIEEGSQTTVLPNCTPYIWVLLVLNILLISYLASKSSEFKKAHKNLWWFIAILALVPTILGYPECWLVVWLGLVFLLELGIIYTNKDNLPKPPVTPKSHQSNTNFEPPKSDPPKNSNFPPTLPDF